MKGAHVKFSLSGRDGDSNRFLPSWGIIPNTHPYSPRQGRIGSPLVQLRSKSRVRPTPYPQRYYQSARKLRTRTHPWTHTIGSPHILTNFTVRTLTEWGPTWVELLGFTVGTTYPPNYVRGMCSTWQEGLQRPVLKWHRQNHYTSPPNI